MASKQKFSTKDELGDEELDELLNDPEKLAAVLDKKPPAPRKSKRQSGQKETATLARERQNMRSNKSIERKYWKECYRRIPDSQDHLSSFR